jgi:tetratricopeptide (TPR) repeat protein
MGVGAIEDTVDFPAPPAIAVVPAGTHAAAPELRALQDGLVHLLQSGLAQSTGAQLVSRHRTSLFLDELGMGAAQFVDLTTAQRFGHAVSADYLVLVRVRSMDGELSATATAKEIASGEQVWRGEVAGSVAQLGDLASRLAGDLRRELRLPAPFPPGPDDGPTPALAVLDFRSTGDAGELDRHLTDLADLLSADLDALGIPLVERHRLDVVLKELGLSASGLVRKADMANVGRLLGAERILDTTMLVSGDAVLFDSQLIHPETGLVVGTSRASGDRLSIPALLQELAAGTAASLRTPVTAWGRRRLAERATNSLEAALHAAAGWRLGAAGRAEEAVERLKQAVYLDPDVAWWWYQLGEQYTALGDFANLAETIRRSFPAVAGKADTQMLSAMAFRLSYAEAHQGNWAGVEAAARLALYYHEDQDGYYPLFRALGHRRQFHEARAFLDSILDRRDFPYYNQVRVSEFLLDHGSHVVRASPDEDAVRWQLSNVARTMDAFRDGGPIADMYLGVHWYNALLACSSSGYVKGVDLNGPPRYVQECLELARRMTEFQHDLHVPSRGWLLTAIFEYKLGHPEQALDALERCLSDYGDAHYDEGKVGYGGLGATAGGVYWLMGRVYQDLLGDRDAAIVAYQKALLVLDPAREDAADARARLRSIGGREPPPVAMVAFSGRRRSAAGGRSNPRATAKLPAQSRI